MSNKSEFIALSMSLTSNAMNSDLLDIRPCYKGKEIIKIYEFFFRKNMKDFMIKSKKSSIDLHSMRRVLKIFTPNPVVAYALNLCK